MIVGVVAHATERVLNGILAKERGVLPVAGRRAGVRRFALSFATLEPPGYVITLVCVSG